MRKIKFFDILFCWQFVALGIACAVMPGCSADTASATTSSIENVGHHDGSAVENASQMDAIQIAENADLSVSGQGFFHALLSLNEDLMGAGRINLQMPAIWVFSPQGDLAGIVQDEQALEAFQSEFSGIDPQAPNITCQSVEEAVVNTAEETWNMGCADGKWTALLLVGPNTCGTSCTQYKSVLTQTAQKHQDALQAKTLLVDLRS